jgi:hypothetical protein
VRELFLKLKYYFPVKEEDFLVRELFLKLKYYFPVKEEDFLVVELFLMLNHCFLTLMDLVFKKKNLAGLSPLELE